MSIRSWYYVEEFVKKTFLGFPLTSMVWKPVQVEYSGWGESWWTDARFDTLRAAYDFMKNLQKDVPEDKILKQS
jgi:hypothetical protein